MDQSLRASAEHYQGVARHALRVGNPLMARMAFKRCLETWKKAASLYPSLRPLEEEARQEYTTFLRSDTTYEAIIADIKQAILSHAGLRQSELGSFLPEIHKRDLDHALYFALQKGEIQKSRQDETFVLHLPAMPRKNRWNLLTRLFAHTAHS